MSLVSQLDRDHVMFWFTKHYTVPDFTVTVDALFNSLRDTFSLPSLSHCMFLAQLLPRVNPLPGSLLLFHID